MRVRRGAAVAGTILLGFVGVRAAAQTPDGALSPKSLVAMVSGQLRAGGTSGAAVAKPASHKPTNHKPVAAKPAPMPLKPVIKARPRPIVRNEFARLQGSAAVANPLAGLKISNGLLSTIHEPMAGLIQTD